MRIQQWRDDVAQANQAELTEHPILEMMASIRRDAEDAIIWALNTAPDFLQNTILLLFSAWLLYESGEV